MLWWCACIFLSISNFPRLSDRTNRRVFIKLPGDTLNSHHCFWSSPSAQLNPTLDSNPLPFRQLFLCDLASTVGIKYSVTEREIEQEFELFLFLGGGCGGRSWNWKKLSAGIEFSPREVWRGAKWNLGLVLGSDDLCLVHRPERTLGQVGWIITIFNPLRKRAAIQWQLGGQIRPPHSRRTKPSL